MPQSLRPKETTIMAAFEQIIAAASHAQSRIQDDGFVTDALDIQIIRDQAMHIRACLKDVERALEPPITERDGTEKA